MRGTDSEITRWARTKFPPEPKQKFPHRLLHWFLSSSLVRQQHVRTAQLVLNILCIVPLICVFPSCFQRSLNSAQDQQGPLQTSALKLVAHARSSAYLQVALRYLELHQALLLPFSSFINMI